MVFGSAQKGIKHWIFNRFLLVNSEMWIRTEIKLPHDLGVCQKTVGNSAGDFHGGGERKTPTSWIRTAIKSPTTPCIWWKSLTSPWETITVRIGLNTDLSPIQTVIVSQGDVSDFHHIQGVVGDLIAVRVQDVGVFLSTPPWKSPA